MSDFRRLYPYVRPHLPLLGLSLALLVLAGVFEVLTTSLAIPLFDDVLAAPGTEARGPLERFAFLRRYLALLPGNAVFQLALGLLMLTALKGVSIYYSNYWMARVGQSVVMGLRNALYVHVMRQSIGFFSLHSTGRLMSRMSSDVEQIQEAVSTTIAELFRESVLLLFLTAWILYIDWKLALLALGIVPGALVLTLTMGKRIRRASWKSRENIAHLSDRLQQTLTGMRVVKAFSMEEHEATRFRGATRKLLNVNMRAYRILFLNAPLMELLGVLAFVPLLYYAHVRISEGTLSLGIFSGSLFALFRMYDPVRKLSRIHIQFQKSFASAARVMELLDTRVEIEDRPGAIELRGRIEDIEFAGVQFEYDDRSGASRVLENIDLRVRRGQVIALVGSSGAGKSTLVSLLPRFYDITGGAIRINGIDIRDLTQESLRRNIAIVGQETFLFNDSVHSNIAYGKAAATEAEIRQAARAALVHDFVDQFPMKYDTLIGERGQRLSGGERQRISIARAILKNSPILILDEATSALDSASEKLVQHALANLMRDRTTFVIAHRLSTVRRADLIVVLEDGRIRESGNHEALMAKGGLYRKLVELQTEEIGSSA